MRHWWGEWLKVIEPCVYFGEETYGNGAGVKFCGEAGEYGFEPHLIGGTFVSWFTGGNNYPTIVLFPGKAGKEMLSRYVKHIHNWEPISDPEHYHIWSRAYEILSQNVGICKNSQSQLEFLQAEVGFDFGPDPKSKRSHWWDFDGLSVVNVFGAPTKETLGFFRDYLNYVAGELRLFKSLPESRPRKQKVVI